MSDDIRQEDTEAQAIIDIATRAAEPTIVRDDVALVATVDGVKVVDLGEHLDKYRAAPRRKTGTFRVHDAESFGAYMSKHGTVDSEVWADTVGFKIVGVINAHEGADGPVGVDGPAAGWGDHRVAYAVEHTKAWKAWAEHDGKLLPQATFADLIEDRAIDIMVPSAADMLELSQTFQATTDARYESTQQLSSGERQFEYREQIDAKAGRAGRLSVPKEFKLALKPFEGAEIYGVTARLRYRITDGALRLGYRLERPEDVLRDAFEDVVQAISTAVSQPVFRGVSS